MKKLQLLLLSSKATAFITTCIYYRRFFSPLNDIKPSVKAYSTSIEERRDGHTAHQILQKQTLPSYKDGDKRSQRVVERQIAHLEGNKRTF